MPVPTISMHHLTELLRLQAAGLSQRQMAQSLGLSLGVINKYLRLAGERGLAWPLPEGMTEAALRQALGLDTSRSTLITSQLPISAWHAYLNDPTVADALLDRLLQGAHRLELSGDSMRKKSAPLTKAEAKQ